MRTQRSADIASGCLSLILLGIVVLVAASQIRGGMEERLPPRTLPYIVGGTLLACGALLALKARRFAGTETPIKWPGREAMIRIGVSLLTIVVFIAVMTPLGFPFSSVNEEATQRVVKFLKEVLNTEKYPLTVLDRPIEYETAKIVENSFRATILAFLDEWSLFAERMVWT